MQRRLRGLLSSGLWTGVLSVCACGPIGSEGTAPASPNGTPTGSAGTTAGSAGSASAGTSGSAGTGGSGQEAMSATLPLVGTPTALWDFTGIIGTGQSLSVGAQAGNITASAMTQQFNNLKLSLGTLTVPPFNSDAPELSLVPLTEPIRQTANGYPSAYPRNMYGESPHTAMSVAITALAKSMGGLGDFVTVHTVVGESGQGINIINKAAMDVTTATSSMGRAYAASMFEVNAIKRLAGAQSKTYGVGAIFLTHGEADAGNANYENDMLKLWSDYNADIKAATGQTQDVPLFTSQQHGIYMYALGQGPTNINISTLLQWKAGLDHPGQIVCTGPKYQYPYFMDWLHLVPLGYELMGEKYAEVFYQHVLLGHPWQPLQPLANTVTRSGKVITVDFQVPVPPLAWDDVLPKPHQSDLTEWAQGRGFEVRVGSTHLTIESVELLDADTVQITCSEDVPAGATLGYAATSDAAAISGVSPRWGQLKDSDPFVGGFTNMVQPNYSVAFELPIQ
jgi:hypothetical protein